MKKFLLIFLTLFIFISNSDASTTFYLGEKVPEMHVGTISSNFVSHNGVPFIIRREDGEYVYCLDHQNTNLSGSYNSYKENAEIFGLTDEQINKINLYSYFGYGYENHSAIKWYGVTQFLIWKTLNYRDVFFTDTAYGNRIAAYNDEMNEIKKLVNEYNKLPSFSSDIFELNINDYYEITDTNGVLSDYKIKSSTIKAEIKDDILHINTEKSGKYEIVFIKESPINRDYILYDKSGNQPLIYPGKIDDIEFKINISVNSGSITINNFDSEKYNRDFADLYGAVYGIYNDKELITTITPDINGVGFIDEIPLGKYYVKQIKSGIGYKLDNNIYEISITKDNKDIVIDSYNEIIKGNLIINKYYGEENNYKLKNDALFEIYNINDKFIGEYKSSDDIELEYGKYYIAQKDLVEGHKLEDKKYINVLEEKNYEVNFYDEIIKGNLIINKYYKDNDDYKLENGAIFEIYDINYNLIGKYETINGVINVKLNYGKYYIIQKSGIEGYEFSDNSEIFIFEEKDYILDLYSEKEKLEEVLIVEVPNTKKYDYNKIISILLIIFGLIFIIKYKKKTT